MIQLILFVTYAMVQLFDVKIAVTLIECSFILSRTHFLHKRDANKTATTKQQTVSGLRERERDIERRG